MPQRHMPSYGARGEQLPVRCHRHITDGVHISYNHSLPSMRDALCPGSCDSLYMNAHW